MWELRKSKGKGCNSLGLFWGGVLGRLRSRRDQLVLADFVELDTVECKYASLDTTICSPEAEYSSKFCVVSSWKLLRKFVWHSLLSMHAHTVRILHGHH